MKKTFLIYFAITALTLNLTVNNYGQLGSLIKTVRDSIDKKKQKTTKEAEKTGAERGGATQTELQTNPRARSGYDANLKPGDRAIAVNDLRLVDPVKILARSGQAYKVVQLESPNNTYWYNANSVYPYFDNREFERIMSDNKQYLSPYLDCYAKKHNLDIDNVADPSHSSAHYDNAEQLKKALQANFPKLIEIENRLKSKLQARPDTFLDFRYNPAIWEEIVTNRDQYVQCMVSAKEEEPDPFLDIFLEEIAKAQTEVEAYTPETKIYLIAAKYYEWLPRAVSKKAREEWLGQWTKNPAQRQKFNQALDALSAAAARKLPIYSPGAKAYNFHNPAEEKMMKNALKAPATAKIYKTGLNQANWLIEKNSLGIPTARFKRGMIWLKYQGVDHPYCYMTYVNLIQDYAGGGTYGASYAKFIQEELSGCPAGQ